jgi:hypothetical protein
MIKEKLTPTLDVIMNRYRCFLNFAPCIKGFKIFKFNENGSKVPIPLIEVYKSSSLYQKIEQEKWDCIEKWAYWYIDGSSTKKDYMINKKLHKTTLGFCNIYHINKVLLCAYN